MLAFSVVILIVFGSFPHNVADSQSSSVNIKSNDSSTTDGPDLDSSTTDFTSNNDMELNLDVFNETLLFESVNNTNETAMSNGTDEEGETGFMTTLIPDVDQPETTPSEEESRGQELPIEDFCLCDLKVTTCDINCCCDPDCDENDRQVFSHCDERPNPVLDSRYCSQRHLLFTNNTEYSVAFTHLGALCIVTDNLIHRTKYTLVEGAKSPDEYEAITKMRTKIYSWFSEDDTFTHLPLEAYEDGTHIWAVDDGGSFFTMGIPASVIGSSCETSTPLLYLRDTRTSCNQRIQDLLLECETNDFFNAYEYFSFAVVANPKNLFQNDSHMTTTEILTTEATTIMETTGINDASTVRAILATDKPMNNSHNENELKQESPASNLIVKQLTDGRQFPLGQLLPVRPYICLTELEETCIEAELSSLPHPVYRDGICHNVISKVNYIVIHNGSGGIYDVQGHIHLVNVTSTSPHVMQSFDTTFRWESEEGNLALERSGRPGYIRGKPLLMGTLIANRSEDDVLKEAISLDVDPRRWLMILAPDREGKCNSSTRVTFGVDMRSGCIFEISQENFEKDCDHLQQKILDKLFESIPIEDTNLRIASYGDSSVNNPANWVPVFIVQEPRCDTLGYGTSKHHNLITSIHLEVAFSLQGSLANPQAKIVGVSIRYGEVEDIRSSCPLALCPRGSGVSLELKSSVSFVDVSRQPMPAYARPPALDVKLPYDFFYPFLPSSSESISFQRVSAFLGVFLCIILT